MNNNNHDALLGNLRVITERIARYMVLSNYFIILEQERTYVSFGKTQRGITLTGELTIAFLQFSSYYFPPWK